jgi:hypothetical protein
MFTFLKAPGDWRTPKRFAFSQVSGQRASVLECGGPPPLFPRRSQELFS